jgi:hypothetical protein
MQFTGSGRYNKGAQQRAAVGSGKGDFFHRDFLLQTFKDGSKFEKRFLINVISKMIPQDPGINHTRSKTRS